MPTSLTPSSLANDDPRRLAVSDLETALGVDQDFPGYRNLIGVLVELLGLVQSLGPVNSQRVADCLDGLRIRDQEGVKVGEREIAPSFRAGNPLGGRFARYPIPSFLLQSAPLEIDGQALGLKALVLIALLSGRLRRQDSANILRKAISPKSTTTTFLSALPTLAKGRTDYIERLSDHLDQQQLQRADALSPQEHALFRTVVELLPRNQSARPGVGRSAPREAQIGGLQELELPLGGTLDRHIAHPPRQESEPPRWMTLFRARDEEVTDEAAAVQSEEEVDAAARQTRRWLARHEKLVPGDYGRFTAAERRRIAQGITGQLTQSDQEARAAAGILALSYCTGALPEAVMGYTFGPGGDLTPEGGYVRGIARPEDGYRPPPALAPFLAPSATTVRLPLPQLLADWLGRDARPGGGELGTCLGTTWAAIRPRVDRLLEELRADGRYRRIRIERMAAALALELTLIRHDPALTHLLAASPSQAPPVLAYYVAHPVGYLQCAYAEAIERMLDAT